MAVHVFSALPDEAPITLPSPEPEPTPVVPDPEAIYGITNLSVGNGILYLGPVGITPTIDVGLTRSGAVLTIDRERIEVTGGSPQHLVDALAVNETVTLAVIGLEWNVSNLARALGVGITIHTGSLENLSLGGDAEFEELALLFRHVTKAGHTIFVKLWEATGNGIAKIEFNERIHEFVYGFEAQEASIDWAGNSLDENRRLFEIERIKI